MTIPTGPHLGPYEILALIGEGGMGVVYRARDPRLGREVAIKGLQGGAAENPERLTRFEREAQSASALNHPNILTIRDVGSQDGQPLWLPSCSIEPTKSRTGSLCGSRSTRCTTP